MNRNSAPQANSRHKKTAPAANNSSQQQTPEAPTLYQQQICKPMHSARKNGQPAAGSNDAAQGIMLMSVLLVSLIVRSIVIMTVVVCTVLNLWVGVIVIVSVIFIFMVITDRSITVAQRSTLLSWNSNNPSGRSTSFDCFFDDLEYEAMISWFS